MSPKNSQASDKAADKPADTTTTPVPQGPAQVTEDQKETPPEPKPAESLTQAMGVTENAEPAEQGPVAEDQKVLPWDDYREQHRKMDNQREVDRFAEERPQVATQQGSKLRQAADVMRSLGSGVHGLVMGAGGPGGPAQVTRMEDLDLDSSSKKSSNSKKK